jgi:hypothetical protein
MVSFLHFWAIRSFIDIDEVTLVKDCLDGVYKLAYGLD